MDVKQCVCSGIRSCLLCEPNKVNQRNNNYNNYIDYYYCVDCHNKAFIQEFRDHRYHTFDTTYDSSHNSYTFTQLKPNKHFLTVEGIYLKSDVMDVKQELDLIRRIDSIEWIDSQSGRRKQDFGPKVNFKKKRLKFNDFKGLPDFDLNLLENIRKKVNESLNDFIAVEVCHLDYNSVRGSSIDSHFDDFWLWGKRLVTVNLLSKTILNLILPPLKTQQTLEQHIEHRIRVVLPERSLLVLSDECRFKYQHSIESRDINGRRIAITYRELSPEFLPGGNSFENWGQHIISRSLNALNI